MFFVFKTGGDNSLNKQQKELQKLEEYYNAGEYGKMYSYLETLDYRGATFEKYRRVGRLYNDLDWRIEAVTRQYDYVKVLDLEIEDIATSLSYAFDELVQISEYEEEGFVYGEEEGALFIRQKYVAAFKEYMKLTESEIENTVNKAKAGDSDKAYIEAARIAVSRIKGDK